MCSRLNYEQSHPILEKFTTWKRWFSLKPHRACLGWLKMVEFYFVWENFTWHDFVTLCCCSCCCCSFLVSCSVSYYFFVASLVSPFFPIDFMAGHAARADLNIAPVFSYKFQCYSHSKLCVAQSGKLLLV